MLIDDLCADHHDDAVELWRTVELTRPWNDPYADLARAMANPTSTVLAAQDEAGRLLGTAMVGHDGHRGWVYYLAVAPSVGGNGLGRQLMHACERWLLERGVPKVNLVVRTTNRAVLAFYESLGYEDGEVVVLGKFLGDSPVVIED